MRFFIKILAAAIVALLIAGLLTYPVWLLVTEFADYRADRVTRRLGVLFLATALIWILRREGQIDRVTFGYGLPRRDFLRQMSLGFAAGVILMTLLAAAIIGLDIRHWNSDLTSIAFGRAALVGLVAGFAVAFLEESLVRGLMFRAIQRESGATAAVVLPSILFAAGHFMLDPAKMRSATNAMNFGAGLKIAANAFADFAEPLAHLDAFCALFALGVLLSLLRLRSGAIAGSIGLHAGGVAVIFLVGDFSTMNLQAQPPWLIPSYNHVVGWLAFIWISAVAIVYWVMNRRPSSGRVLPVTD